ncbi:MAG: glutamate--tRNA ligase family protein [Patescibacteria group bacterium]
MDNIKVRYGPSPTGIPHIGNIRTALFNFLFAKSKNGQFFLRIEDTDQARIVPGAVEKIQQSLKLLGLLYDGEIIYQSKRLDIYQKHLEILKEKKLAYLDDGAWRFKINASDPKIGWQDLVHGQVEFPTNVLEDFIIIKSDGFPTYHFASVVDDHLMEISHVLRGDEWISSTPKHLLLYDAFDWKAPEFAHLPPILGPDHKKLSKRDGAKSVMEYINEGYLPEALINFMVLLGWSPKGDQEIFSLDQLCSEFSLERINKNSPVFNLEKLDWFNGQWIRKIYEEDNHHLKKLVQDKTGFSDILADKIIESTYTRVKKINDFSDYQYLIKQPKIDRNLLMFHDDAIDVLRSALRLLSNLKVVKDETIRSVYKKLDEDYSNWSMTEIIQLIGRSISGRKYFLPLLDMANIIGNKLSDKLENAIEQAEKQK